MGVCNEDCNCLMQGVEGIEVNGLGTTGSPYLIGTEANRMIPMFGTATARTALAVTADDAGLVFVETDTGRTYTYIGGGYGWVPLAPVVEQDTGAANFAAGSDVYQNFASLILGPGIWALSGKGYTATQLGDADAVDERIVEYTARLALTTAGTEPDVTVFHGGIGPHAIIEAHLAAVAGIIERHPFSLQALVRLTVADTVTLDVKRDDDPMSAGVNAVKLQAMWVGYSTSV